MVATWSLWEALISFFPRALISTRSRHSRPDLTVQAFEEQFRPGHLDGVRTIVERLFLTVGASRVYFGEKDFQQTLVVADLAREMGYPEVVVCPTVREDSGLALSSRNVRLSADEKTRAEQIYPALLAARDAWSSGERDPGRLSAIMIECLNHDGLVVEYAEVRDPGRWIAQPSGNPSRTRSSVNRRPYWLSSPDRQSETRSVTYPLPWHRGRKFW